MLRYPYLCPSLQLYTVEMVISTPKQNNIIEGHGRREDLAANMSFCHQHLPVLFEICQYEVSIIGTAPESALRMAQQPVEERLCSWDR